MIAWSSLVTSVSAWMETRWQLPLLGWDTITLAAVSTALSFYLATRDRSGLPGPVALPILGNIPGILLSGSIDTYLDKMRENYGDVSRIVYSHEDVWISQSGSSSTVDFSRIMALRVQ